MREHHTEDQVRVLWGDAALSHLETEALPQRIYFLGGMEDRGNDPVQTGSQEEAQERGIIALFRMIKTLIGRYRGALPCHLTVAVDSVHVLSPDESIRPAFAALAGFTMSLAKEYPRLGVTLADLALSQGEDLQAAARFLVSQPPDPRGEPVLLRGGIRFPA